ncbi:hypothetical protein IQ07DRAFT_678756 [Pyrenochaeta sp. DS3sAY3a]|nr:hypothetical protein IQ07DRAFT_678756 [Pyrenochaeta sp. DS3sAY3a]
MEDPRTPSSHPNSPRASFDSTSSQPPPYTSCADAHPAFPADYPSSDSSDEESQCGFWGERSSTCTSKARDLSGAQDKKKRTGLYTACCLWCAVSMCVVGVLGMFLLVDVVLAQFGRGVGVVQWMLRCWRRRAEVTYTLQFCLSPSDRAAPGPQIWRYLASGNIDSCSTQVLTLLASSLDGWKLLPGDQVLIGDDVPVEPQAEPEAEKFVQFPETTSRAQSVEERIRRWEGEGASEVLVGDNVAAEGRLGYPY